MLTIRISRRVALLLILGMFMAIPAASWASHQFTDVPDSNTFHADIGWLADAGITLGCNPPTNDRFCPDDGVTRAQMSAFMRRLAVYLDAEDGTPGFADTAGDADTLDGLDSTDFADVSSLATKVDTADMLFATVAPGGASAAIVRGNGATGVTRVGTGYYQVDFNRDVTGCTWIATAGEENNSGVSSNWATTRGRASTSAVGVVIFDETGAQSDTEGFHIAVLCP